MAKKTKQQRKVDVAEYWVGAQTTLQARLTAIKTSMTHPASGTVVEGYFRDLLRDYLPRRYAVESGFVVNVAGERSANLDIVVADLENIPPLCFEPLLKIFPAESVVAAIEITAAPSRAKFAEDIKKLADLRRIAKAREYVERFAKFGIKDGEESLTFPERKFSMNLAPRTLLITCGDEWKRPETYESHVIASLNHVRDQGHGPWIQAALSMRHGLLTFKPYKTYETKWHTENALLEFILLLSSMASSYRTYRTNIRRYRPIPPDVASE